MKLDAKNNESIRDFENWVKGELYGPRKEAEKEESMNEQEWRQNRWRKIFYETQKQGTEEFGNLFLQANNAAVQATVGDFNHGEQQVRALMSVTILAVLRTTRRRNQ